MLHPQRDRQEEDRDQRQSARAGFEDPPDRDSPRPAGRVVEHDDREAPEREPGEEDVGEEVAAEEGAGGGDGAGRARGERDHARHERRAAQPVDRGGQALRGVDVHRITGLLRPACPISLWTGWPGAGG